MFFFSSFSRYFFVLFLGSLAAEYHFHTIHWRLMTMFQFQYRKIGTAEAIGYLCAPFWLIFIRTEKNWRFLQVWIKNPLMLEWIKSGCALFATVFGHQQRRQIVNMRKKDTKTTANFTPWSMFNHSAVIWALQSNKVVLKPNFVLNLWFSNISFNKIHHVLKNTKIISSEWIRDLWRFKGRAKAKLFVRYLHIF